jgi:hypothetical protein
MYPAARGLNDNAPRVFVAGLQSESNAAGSGGTNAIVSALHQPKIDQVTNDRRERLWP